VSPNKEIKLIENGSGSLKINMTDWGSFAFHYFHVWGYNATNNSWESIQFTRNTNDDVHSVINLGKGDREFRWIYSRGIAFGFDLSGYDEFIFDFFSKHQIAPNGPVNTVLTIPNVKVKKVKFIDNITLKPNSPLTCFDMNGFSLNKVIAPDIEGFCGLVQGYDLSLPPGATPTNGLPIGFTKKIKEGENIPLIPNNCNEYDCGTAIPNPPAHSPCNCIKMDVSFTLYPCNDDLVTCPPMNLTKQIDVCCKCNSAPPVTNN